MSWTLIEHQALSSSAASVTLGSGGTIPQTYKTLKLVLSTICSTDNIVEIRPNNATANQTRRSLYGTGSAAGSGTGTNIRAASGYTSYTANTPGNSEVTFPNYTSTTTNKPISADGVAENNATAALQLMEALLWSDTSAITSIVVIAPSSGTMSSGSTFTLYGLA